MKERYTAALLWLLVGLPACQRRPHQTPAPAASATLLAAPSAPQADGRLPEDPVAGARAVALWHEHLVEEERERKAFYDRRRLREHRVVLGFLRQTQASYDRAPSKAAVLAVRRAVAPGLAATRLRVDKIDHYGTSSNVLADYQQLLDALAGPYPDARIAALQGNGNALSALQAEATSRLEKIADWLAFVARTDDD